MPCGCHPKTYFFFGSSRFVRRRVAGKYPARVHRVAPQSAPRAAQFFFGAVEERGRYAASASALPSLAAVLANSASRNATARRNANTP